MVRAVCPEIGELRRSLDEPVESVDAHVEDCEACRETVTELRETAAFAAAAVASIAAAPGSIAAAPADAAAPAATRASSPAARASSTAARAPSGSARGLLFANDSPSPAGGAAGGAGRRERGPGGEGAPVPATRPGWRYAAAGLAAVIAVATVVAVPAAQTAAAQFLAQFRSQRFAAVQVDPSNGVFAHLKDLGVIQDPGRQRPQPVASVAEAGQRVGFALRQPDPAALPAGLTGEPRLQVVAAHQLRLTFQKAKAQEYLRRVGRPDHPVPERLDGATLVVNVPSAALMSYRGASSDQSVVIGQAGEVTAGVEGNATLDELRDYLLGLPGLPPEAVRQLRAIQDWRTTLPIPVPLANMTWQDTTVGGAPALMLADPTGLGSGVIWQQGGRIYGVAGSFRSQEILRVANGLR